MIFRLLYRLFLQRLDQRSREAEPQLAIPRQQHSIGQAEKYHAPKRRFAFAIILAGLLTLGWQVLALRPKNIINAQQAELHLRIVSSDTWPLVAYLQGAGLPRPELSSTQAPTSQIESANGTFVPEFQVLPTAGTLVITNKDNIAHNTHVFNRGDTIFNVALPVPGIRVRKTLTGSGMFSVRCDLHPWMQAWLFVPPTRYYAVINESDIVSFRDLPPGQYVLNLWETDGSEHGRLISLAAGETKTLRLQ